jgi:putative RNA 2'-phosphotransferase
MKHNNLITTKSKFLSLVLRHDPKKIGIVLDSNGWADVVELCEKMPISKEDLDEIVLTDSKGRYSYSDNKAKIRANQGHSIDVDVELEELEPPEFLWHGTATKSMDSILKYGVKSMSRHYVHLSLDKETAIKVGSRHGTPALLKVKAREMHNDGHKFFLSKNNVWLVLNVPVLYFSRDLGT